MRVLILAAGYGTRLYPLTKDTPKPLLPIQGKPLVDYLLEKVQNLPDLRAVMVVTNNKFFPHFQNWAKQHQNFKNESPLKENSPRAQIRILNDGTDSNENRLGSMGDIDFVLRKEAINEDLLVLGGDNLFNQGLDEFVQTAKNKSPRVTIGLFDLRDKGAAKNFGVVSLDQKKRVVSFEEKPQNPQSSLIGMCLYYFPKDSLGLIRDYLNETKRADTSGDYIQWLFKKEDVYAVVFQGKWYDIGSLEAYEEAQKSFRN